MSKLIRSLTFLSFFSLFVPFRQKIKENFPLKYWQNRILFFLTFGYAIFYIVRQNFSMACPALELELGYSKTHLGWIMTLFSITYGFGKITSGIMSDQLNARYFMSTGLFLSAFMSLLIGLSSSCILFFLFWIANAYFQSMGAPPCQKLLMNWFSSKEISTKWAIWHASQQIGVGFAAIITGYSIIFYGWRAAFIVPSIIAFIFSFFLLKNLRDAPNLLGLHLPDENKVPLEEENNLSFKESLFNHVIYNRQIWYICFANMFIYILRIGILNWGPTFLVETQKSTFFYASWQILGFEFMAIIGGIASGILSDKFFLKRQGAVGAIFMLILAPLFLCMWQVPKTSNYVLTIIFFVIGFFISGPQVLQGVAAGNCASKKTIGTANGLTGAFGYMGAAFSGVGVGKISDIWTWDGVFIIFTISSFIGAFFFILIWMRETKLFNITRH